MRTLWETTALLGLAMLLAACEPAPTPAPAPTPVPSTPSAVVTPPPAPVAYRVKLLWSAPSTRANGTALPLSELSGYRLYYLREGSDASNDTTISVQGGTTTSYDLTLQAAGSYTFAITAVDQNGLESPLSSAVSVPVN